MTMKGKQILNWISRIFTILLVTLLLMMFVVLISSKASGEAPSLFGYEIKRVLSGSMEPEMPTGSVILVKQLENTSNLEIGDVITFETNDNLLVTHRIIEIVNGNQSYITQGDNNNGPDVEPVLAQNVVGKYTGIMIPYVGYITHFLNTQQGALLFFVLPGLFFLGYAVFTIWRTLQMIEAPKDMN